MKVSEIKAVVRARDGQRCTKCGITTEAHIAKTGRDLEVHRKNPGSLYSIDACITLCRTCHGPEAKRQRGQPDLNNNSGYEPVKIRASVLHKARIVAAYRDTKIAAFLSDLLEPLLDIALAEHERAGISRRVSTD